MLVKLDENSHFYLGAQLAVSVKADADAEESVTCFTKLREIASETGQSL
ncbi:MAG: hypothetical protein ACLP9S_17095 [Syntrophales bacterium]